MTTSPLKLAHADVPGPSILRIPDHHAPTREPVPLMRLEIDQQTPGGHATDRILLWENAAGSACRWCPKSRCTFTPGPEGQGICVVRDHSGA